MYILANRKFNSSEIRARALKWNGIYRKQLDNSRKHSPQLLLTTLFSTQYTAAQLALSHLDNMRMQIIRRFNQVRFRNAPRRVLLHESSSESVIGASGRNREGAIVCVSSRSRNDV